jgi:RNA ligase (TIGR02306 family)
MRKLATVETILDVTPVENSDNLDVVTVRGWKCVTKRNTFSVGDSCIYFEIDSLIPNSYSWSNFLKTTHTNSRGLNCHRLRTIKLRGQISQGLVIPLREIYKDETCLTNEDLTTQLGIELYEPPVLYSLSGKVIRPFPSFITKTDEERVQNILPELKDFSQTAFYITEKLDGTSFTAYLKDGKFGVCSRNLELEEEEGNLYWKIARQYDIENKLREAEFEGYVQGEIIGEGVQKNKYNLKGQRLYVFKVFDFKLGRALSIHELYSFVQATLFLSLVPLIRGEFYLPPENTLEELIKLTTMSSYIYQEQNNPLSQIEGLVFRTRTPHPDFHFKVINPEFLLKHGE